MKLWISRHHLIAAGTAAAILTGLAATPALAQVSGAAPIGMGDANSMGGVTSSFVPNWEAASIHAGIRTVTPSRLALEERLEFEAEDLEQRRRRMSDAQLREDITFQLEKAGVECALGDFKRVGMTPQRQSIYEAVCGSGPGYVLVNGAYPQATSCLVLAGAATNVRRRNADARVGAQCELPDNQNGQQVIGAWAREAGVTCRVDEAQWLGSSEAGFDTYEVGCAGSEGFWLEKASNGWSLRGCLQVNSEGLNCRYTDAAEQRSWMRARLAGTAAEGCDVADIRVVGVSAQGNYYETRCRAPGEGFLVRIAREEQAEEVRSCAAATRAMACTMTEPRGQSNS